MGPARDFISVFFFFLWAVTPVQDELVYAMQMVRKEIPPPGRYLAGSAVYLFITNREDVLGAMNSLGWPAGVLLAQGVW